MSCFESIADSGLVLLDPERLADYLLVQILSLFSKKPILFAVLL